MKTKAMILMAILVIMLLSACTINLPIAATNNPVGTKIGTYTQMGILGFPPLMNNDECISKAAQNGGITRISTVSHRVTYMVIFAKYETVVSGE